MILAIDSSGLTASAALLNRDIMIAEYTVDLKKTHSETLLPMIDEIFTATGIDRTELDAVAVAAGPGSFTGLRIGGATAKGIASALDIPIVAVPTLDALAYNFYSDHRLICPIMDARRSQTYTGIYEYEKKSAAEGGYELNALLSQCAISVEELIDKLNGLDRETVFTGDGIPVFKEIIDRELKTEHFYAPPGLNRQRASSVGHLAYKYMDEGRYVKAADFAPEYLRKSQAEREREQGTE